MHNRVLILGAAALLFSGCLGPDSGPSESPGSGGRTAEPVSRTPSDPAAYSTAESLDRSGSPRSRAVPDPCLDRTDGGGPSGPALEGLPHSQSTLFDGTRENLASGPAMGPGVPVPAADPCDGREGRLPLSAPMKVSLERSYVPAPSPDAGSGGRSIGLADGDAPEIKSAGAVDLTAYQRFQNALYATVYPMLKRTGWDAEDREGRAVKIKPSRITLHHTAGSRTFDREISIRKMRGIQRYHMEGRSRKGKEDFQDIGYHFVIDGKGRIAEGRPSDVLGAHAGRANRGNIGISLMGNYNKQQPTEQQLESLTRLAAFIATKYGIDVARDGRFEGHSRYGNTSCPGKNLVAVLPQLRARIKDEKDALRNPGGRVARSDKYASFVPVNVIV